MFYADDTVIIIIIIYIYNYNIIMMFAHFFRPEDDAGAKILVLLGEANVLDVLHVFHDVTRDALDDLGVQTAGGRTG
jgi:hypothetical protein